MARSRERRVRYSQNFLHNPRLVESLVGASSLEPNDLVIEIGPGDGVITRTLLDRCRHVIAVEVDPVQVARLDRRFGRQPNLTLFAADFLQFPLPCSRYKVFASIPYRATAAIVGKLTTGPAPPVDSYLVVQQEAAERFLGQPRGTLAAMRLAPWFELSVTHRFRRSDFRPVPAVDSVLLRIRRRDPALLPDAPRERYEHFIAAVFGAWQPTVGSALKRVLPPHVAGDLGSGAAGVMGKRPGEVQASEWIALFARLLDRDDARVWMALERNARMQEAQRAALQKRHRTSAAR